MRDETRSDRGRRTLKGAGEITLILYCVDRDSDAVVRHRASGTSPAASGTPRCAGRAGRRRSLVRHTDCHAERRTTNALFAEAPGITTALNKQVRIPVLT